MKDILFKHFDIDLEKNSLPEIFERMHTAGLGNVQIEVSNAETSFGMLLFVTEREFLPFLKQAIVDFDLAKVDDDLPQVCRVCGCSEDFACDGGCWWVEEDLCSTCAKAASKKKKYRSSAG